MASTATPVRFRGLLVLLTGVLSGVAQAADSNPIYDNNCAMCHQKRGAGLAGQFPRLAGRVGEISSTDAGRRYLAQVVLFGMAGQVEVDGTSIIGVMPSFALLSDEDLATALNYVIRLEGAAKGKARSKPTQVTPADMKAVRTGPQLSPTQVRANREAALPVRKK